MTEREQLIKLLDGHSLDQRADVEFVADLLLTNGVILAPCKVGDTIFVVEKDYCDKRDADKCDDYCDGWDAYCVNNLAEYVVAETQYSNSMIDRVGKSVFLTKNEADARCKELNRRINNA